MERDVNISEAEWIVMEAVWSLGRAPAAEIIDYLRPQSDWNHRTIRTLLGRLVEKGCVERIGQTGGSEYRPLLRRQDCIRREGRTFLERVFQGDTNSLLLHFAKEGQLGPEKIAQLRRLLDDDTSE